LSWDILVKSACCVRFVFTTVVCGRVHVLFVLFMLLCIVVSYTTWLYEKRGGYTTCGRNFLTFVSPWVHPGRCWVRGAHYFRLLCCALFCLSSSCILSAQCCQCLWTVNSWFPPPPVFSNVYFLKTHTHTQHTIGTVTKSNTKIVVICKMHTLNINIWPLLFIT
jgi:hypothetical protein